MKKGNASIAVLAVLVVVLVGVAVFYFQSPETSKQDMKRFSSYDELKNFIKSNTEISYGYGGFLGAAQPMMAETTSTATGSTKQAAESTNVPSVSSGSTDYSRTNIQVEGVDEADIIKNDGKYVYVVSGRKVVILDAYPAENASILSEIEMNGTPQEIFINNDKLIIFGYEDYSYSPQTAMPEIGIVSPSYYSPKTFVMVYDVTDRTNPILKRNITIDGNYYDSRMIGDYVYVIANEPVYYSDTQPIPMPVIQSNGNSKAITATDVYYFDMPDSSYVFTNIVSINTQNDAEDLTSKTYLTGYSENMYVSPSNIYLVYTKRLSEYDFYDKIIDEAILPVVPMDVKIKINSIRDSNSTKSEKMSEISKVLQDYLSSLNPEEGANVMKNIQQKMEVVQAEIAKEMEKTVIYKISVINGNIDYKTSGEVPGYVLNQFSMDEYNDNFRIATTTGNWQQTTLNHIYILDSSLQITGKLEDLAHGERIYSVRFIGDKGYMVTFRQIDPLFVIDLSSPTNPQVLGYLKIPGVSDYLHPYDETHIIGIGNNATEAGRINGLKMSLFDVSDFANPKEMSTYIIGGNGTYASSDALYNHKAFLFDKEKQLLVIPVSINTYSVGPAYEYDYWQGAYVFNIDLVNGLTLKGKITHANETENNTNYYDYQSQITRSLFIDNVLYTLSNKMIKMNDLSNLNEINQIELPIEPQRLYGNLVE